MACENNRVQDNGKNHRMNVGKEPIENVQDPMQKNQRESCKFHQTN